MKIFYNFGVFFKEKIGNNIFKISENQKMRKKSLNTYLKSIILIFKYLTGYHLSLKLIKKIVTLCFYSLLHKETP